MINIGENIRKIREYEKSYTQKYMADCLGLTTKAYSNIENGITDITFKRLSEIAEILECDILQIINYNKQASGFNNHFNNSHSQFETNIKYQGTDEEKIAKIEKLYSELLEAERSKVKLLEQMLENKNLRVTSGS